MKSLCLLLLIFTQFAYGTGLDPIGSITERNGQKRKIIFIKSENFIVATLHDHDTEELIYTVDSSSKTLKNVDGSYRFRFFNNMKMASKGVCQDSEMFAGLKLIPIAAGILTTGILVGVFTQSGWPAAVGLAGAVFMCPLGKAAPYIAGGIFSPVDAIITGFAELFHRENIAERKIRKALRGKNVKANSKVFQRILRHYGWSKEDSEEQADINSPVLLEETEAYDEGLQAS